MINIETMEALSNNTITDQHRAQMAEIQGLCLDVSLAGDGVADCLYSGVTHAIYVSFISEDRVRAKIYNSTWSKRIYLPGADERFAAEIAAQKMTEVISRLRKILPEHSTTEAARHA